MKLIEGRSNGSKNDMRLVDYYNDMNDKQQKDFIEYSFIPEDISLEIEDFNEFYERRKERLNNEILSLLS